MEFLQQAMDHIGGNLSEYRRQSGEQKCLADRYVCIVYSFGDMGIFYCFVPGSKSSLGT